jgi:hypothetical protein
MEQVKKFVDREIGDNPKWKGRENVVETKEVDEKKDVSYVNMAMEYLRNRNQDSTCKFEISTIKKYMKGRKLAKELKGEAAAYMSAVLNYLAAEVLELAGDAAAMEVNSKPVIGPRHLKSAIGNDKELSQLLKDVSSTHPVAKSTTTKKRVRNEEEMTAKSDLSESVQKEDEPKRRKTEE